MLSRKQSRNSLSRVVCPSVIALMLLSAPTLNAEERANRTATLEARVDSLRAEASYAEAAELAHGLLRLVQEDGEAYHLDSPRSTFQCVFLLCSCFV